MSSVAPTPHPIPDELAALIARRFRILGDPMRIRILDHLRDGAATVSDIVNVLGAGQQNVSKHLGVLLEAGIVGRRKLGTRAEYSIRDDAVFRLCDDVCGSVRRHLDQLSQIIDQEQ